MSTITETIENSSKKVRRLWGLMNPCHLCPRMCKINRLEGQIGKCGVGIEPLISSAGPHFGEESVLVGKGGSGAIFFAGCNLGCLFCQNYQISHHKEGQKVSIEKLAQMMLDLKEQGCENINLVTPSHFSAACAAAIELAQKDGLELPIIFNSGGYDSIETLGLLDGLIDIYMPDMKYAEPSISLELSGVGNYPRVNQWAVKWMHQQLGDLQIKDGIATKGLLIRHLVLPNNLSGSFEIINYLAEQISPNTAINVMDQYNPCFRADEHSLLNRKPTTEEIEKVKNYALEKGLRLID